MSVLDWNLHSFFFYQSILLPKIKNPLVFEDTMRTTKLWCVYKKGFRVDNDEYLENRLKL